MESITPSTTKCMLYVGGLDEAVDLKLLQAAFVPFGDLTDVQLPMDHVAQKNKGFGFVEFADEKDAHAAVENMNNAELFGRVIRVNIARPQKKGGKAVWADAEEWYEGLGDGPASESKEVTISSSSSSSFSSSSSSSSSSAAGATLTSNKEEAHR